MAKTYAPGQVIYGEGTKLRIRILAAGSRARPTNWTDADVLAGVTTSTITGNQTDVTDPADYDTVSGGFADGRVGQRSWTIAVTAQAKKDTAQAALLNALWDAWADGREAWIERLRPEDTLWRGGVISVTSPSEPVTGDGVVTLPFTGVGRGALVKTAVTP